MNIECSDLHPGFFVQIFDILNVFFIMGVFAPMSQYTMSNVQPILHKYILYFMS
jgi:hypothetical protein